KDLSVLNLVVEKKGSGDVEGLTNVIKPNRLGPKRVGNIRKLLNLSSKDDVRKYVLYRPLPLKGNRTKPKTKAPKIQRLVTPNRLQRKRHLKAAKLKRMKKSK
ncbi:hypothetical protein, partial [Salmonella sp. s51228]|uniref:hypothetical protein n=1 Tax=Salmonella sp. s51228 TaxID=3159652 RepID=UPI00397EAD43